MVNVNVSITTNSSTFKSSIIINCTVQKTVHFSAGYVYGKTVTQDDLRLMLRQADDILYQAKGSGKNTFIGEKYERSYAEKIMKKEEEAFRQG